MEIEYIPTTINPSNINHPSPKIPSTVNRQPYLQQKTLSCGIIDFCYQKLLPLAVAEAEAEAENRGVCCCCVVVSLFRRPHFTSLTTTSTIRLCTYPSFFLSHLRCVHVAMGFDRVLKVPRHFFCRCCPTPRACAFRQINNINNVANLYLPM